MSENKNKKKLFAGVVQKLRYRTVEFNISQYENVVSDINKIDLKQLKDNELQQYSHALIIQARKGVLLNDLLVKAFAVVKEAAGRVLGLHPFDVQAAAGVAMYTGALVEMQTGEGKTLTAVFPAYMNAIAGRGVHVLTFNDYLARRDAEWMGPLYNFLGLSVGYINEGMTSDERRRAYMCDITYMTAKEAGFDYLRNFLAGSRNDLVQRPFNFAVIDEADSILIDEARIPLVIAGRTDENRPEPAMLSELARSLKNEEDYETDEYERNVFLTDKGIARVEKFLNCGNLYSEKNLPLLVLVNNAVHAEVLLKRDIDYIVRKGKIELVDEFTGRIAEKRHWPYGLQEAVEAKEGIKSEHKGQILAQITLHNFIRLYPGICGMTGTARHAADEFAEFYGMRVVVIPTNKPCIRTDFPDLVYTDKNAKLIAVVNEVVKVHETGRPILIGTCSVEESELLAGMLEQAGVRCNVLNAKNDELEAGIIAMAGEIGAVTVSTNMAGRGTDIKLGGRFEEEFEKVVGLGGLYVIGTNRHESRRIDNQLRGRSGRQGDPGSSRFFISLEDDLMKRYKLKELIPEGLYPAKQEVPLESAVYAREIARGQRIIEQQNFEIHRTLDKYSIVVEQQRQMIFKLRRDILLDAAVTSIMNSRLEDRYKRLSAEIGEDVLRQVEKKVVLYLINKCWAEYLDHISYLRETIHLVNLAGKIPVSEFNKTAIESFENLKKDIIDEAAAVLERAEITGEGIDMEKEGLKAPSSTWTYLVNDRPEQLGIMQMPIALDPLSALLSLPVWVASFMKQKKSRNVD